MIFRRCMNCKYWKPIDEAKGKCIKNKDPLFTFPNYVCKKWVFWREKGRGRV